MASVLINMVARQSFRHEGRLYACGEHFQVPAIHAAALKQQRKADYATRMESQRTYHRRDMVAEK